MDSSNLVIHDLKQKKVSPEFGTIIHEEYAIKGTKGLTIKYFHKDNKYIDKIIIFSKNGEYVMRTTEGDKSNETILSKDELLKLLAKDRRIKFALDIVKYEPSKPKTKT